MLLVAIVALHEFHNKYTTIAAVECEKKGHKKIPHVTKIADVY